MGNVLWQSLVLLAINVNDAEYWPRLLAGVVGTLIYGLVGITLVVLGFKVFDWLTPRIDVQRELAEKQNVAVAIVCAAIILGICYLIAVAVA